MALERIPRDRVLSIMPTNTCTASCTSCGTLSSPRATESLTETDIRLAIAEAADLGMRLVVFTGGEPTLAGDVLLRSIAFATARGTLTRVVTNCHWATGDDEACRTIDDLQSAGLTEINFSTGDQHERFVPLLNVLRGVRAALSRGYSPAVMVELVDGRRVTKETIDRHPYQCATLATYPEGTVLITESPWMPLNPLRVQPYPSGVAADRFNVASRRGCDSVLQTLTVQPDGRMAACCGLGIRLIPELNLGKIGSVPMADAVGDAEEDLLKRWIRVEGPERILAWAANYADIDWEGMYGHRCQACLRLYKDATVRSVIRERYMEKVPDILLAEWLLFDLEVDATVSGM